MGWQPSIANGLQYLSERTGKYEYRALRYRAAIDIMIANGLDDTMTVCDVGAGATEFDYCLRTEYGWNGVYVPVDCSIDGTDLNYWEPPRSYDWFVAMEILEHVLSPETLYSKMLSWSNHGVVFSTPDPEHTDVLGMDETHTVNYLTQEYLESLQGMQSVTREMFYGGLWSEGRTDSLLGYAAWTD